MSQCERELYHLPIPGVKKFAKWNIASYAGLLPTIKVLKCVISLAVGAGLTNQASAHTIRCGYMVQPLNFLVATCPEVKE